MVGQNVESLGYNAIFLLIFSFFFVLGILAFLLWIGWWVSTKKGSVSPYTKKPMQLGVDVAHSVRSFVDAFLLSHSQPENNCIDFDTAAYCPDTGRIFPECVRKGEIIKLTWEFLTKRYPGNWVSWGSLSEHEQAILKMCHESLFGFQTEHSCQRTAPDEIDSYHALLKPGPLYVDRVTKNLLGWKEVSGTEFEVLIVQKPIYQSIDETI